MKKVFFILVTFMFTHLGAQNSTTQKFAESFTAINYICYSIPEEQRDGFFSSLTSATSNDDLLVKSRNYLSEEKANDLVNHFTTLSEATAQLRLTGYDENDLKAKIQESEIYPVPPCLNRGAYDKCMAGVMDEYDDAAWTFTAATLGFAGTALATEGIGLFIGAAGYGIAIRQMSNAMDKRNKGIGDCFKVHCEGIGGGSGLPPGGYPTPKYAK